MPDAEDQETIAQVLDGNRNAFARLVRKYQKSVFNVMFRATGSVDTAADLSQEAFARAYDKLGSYRPRKKFFSWLYVIALNVARDHLRRSRRMPEFTCVPLETLSGQGGLGDDALPQERYLDQRTVLQALASLPIDYREALMLRFREGLSMKEIADALDLSTSGAKMRVHRGLDRLKTALGELYNDSSDAPTAFEIEETGR